MKVRVYYNLHKKTWSVQKYIKGKGWRISHHTNKLLLKNAEFKVYKSGQDKVRKEKKKNVHAYVIGEEIKGEYQVVDALLVHKIKLRENHEIYYNPYKVDQFQLDNQPIYKAEYVWMENRRVYV